MDEYIVRLKCDSRTGKSGTWWRWRHILAVLATDEVPVVGRTLGWCPNHGDAIVTAVALDEIAD